MPFSSSSAVFLISLLAIPITYIVNTLQIFHGEAALFICGSVALIGVCACVYLAVRNKGHPTDPFLYVLSICAFGGVASLIIALESDGIIHGFMSEYLRSGEPYLKTAHGTLVSYWDGIGHYALVLMMLSAISWNLNLCEKQSLPSCLCKIQTGSQSGQLDPSVTITCLVQPIRFVGLGYVSCVPTVLVLGLFSSVADIIIALENEGFIKGLMNEYLKDGEPYLLTAHGTWICTWDGIGHLTMYFMILYSIAKHQGYREVGLYWAGSIGHSMVVFIPGNIVGKFGLRWSFLLNVPYMIMPFVSAAKFLRERTSMNLKESYSNQIKSIWRRPLDMFFIVGLTYSIVISLFRGFAVLGSTHSIFTDYITSIEPYLHDPVAYGKIQMLVYLFYYTPYYIMAIYGLLYPGCTWMPDWALLHAGAAAQAQVSHIGASLHHRTPYILRVPPDSTARVVFWTVNMFLLCFPQMLAYRCVQSGELFHKTDLKTKIKQT